MATQSMLVRTHTHRLTLMILGMATILTTVISGGWLLRPTMPATTPVAPVIVPAGAPDRPVANRFFADELGGANAPDLTGAASGMQPEWDQVQIRHTAPVVVGLQPGIVVANRFFADEIGGASAQYTDPASLSGPLPERLQDLPRSAGAPAVVAPLPTFRVANRSFADEIAAGAGIADGTLPEVPVTLLRYGPR